MIGKLSSSVYLLWLFYRREIEPPNPVFICCWDWWCHTHALRRHEKVYYSQHVAFWGGQDRLPTGPAMSGGSREGGWLGVLLCLGWWGAGGQFSHTVGALCGLNVLPEPKEGAMGHLHQFVQMWVRREEVLKAVSSHIKNGVRLVRLFVTVIECIFVSVFVRCCFLVAKLCPTLCNPMNWNTPGFPSATISQSLLKFMSIEWVMPSYHRLPPLSPPSVSSVLL